jgi:hypothetical protein
MPHVLPPGTGSAAVIAMPLTMCGVYKDVPDYGDQTLHILLLSVA